jgi:hypothetical protein
VQETSTEDFSYNSDGDDGEHSDLDVEEEEDFVEEETRPQDCDVTLYDKVGSRI